MAALKKPSGAGRDLTPGTTGLRIDRVSSPGNIRIGLAASSDRAAGPQDHPEPPRTGQANPDRRGNSRACPGPEQTADAPADSLKTSFAGGLSRSAEGTAKSPLMKLALASVALMLAAGALFYMPLSPAGGNAAPAAAPPPAAAAAVTEGDALVARITAGTLEVLRAPPKTPQQPAAAVAPLPLETGSALYRMVAKAAAQGQSDVYIDRMVNAAYAAGEITVPSSLIGASGRVDTATLLALFTGQ